MSLFIIVFGIALKFGRASPRAMIILLFSRKGKWSSVVLSLFGYREDPLPLPQVGDIYPTSRRCAIKVPLFFLLSILYFKIYYIDNT